MAARLVIFPNGDAGDLEVEAVERGRYRVLEHPLVNEGCGLHDIVDAEETPDGSLRLVRVVRRGPWRTIGLLVCAEVAGSRWLREQLALFEAQGGRWDLAFGGGVWLHVPRPGRPPPAYRELRSRLRPDGRGEAGGA